MILFRPLLCYITTFIKFLSYLMLASTLYGCDKGGIAPSGSTAIRHQWGITELGNTYLEAVKWVENSTTIKKDVGIIRSIAPVGRNMCFSQVPDSDSCKLVLEVEGSQGTGIINIDMPSIDHNTNAFKVAYFYWQFSNQKSAIHWTGIAEAVMP